MKFNKLLSIAAIAVTLLNNHSFSCATSGVEESSLTKAITLADLRAAGMQTEEAPIIPLETYVSLGIFDEDTTDPDIQTCVTYYNTTGLHVQSIRARYDSTLQQTFLELLDIATGAATFIMDVDNVLLQGEKFPNWNINGKIFLIVCAKQIDYLLDATDPDQIKTYLIDDGAVSADEECETRLRYNFFQDQFYCIQRYNLRPNEVWRYDIATKTNQHIAVNIPNCIELESVSFRNGCTFIKFRNGGFDDRMARYQGAFEGEPTVYPEGLIDIDETEEGDLSYVFREGIWRNEYDNDDDPKTSIASESQSLQERTGFRAKDLAAACYALNINNFDGTKTPTFISVPHGIKEDERIPALIHIHGGPEDNEGYDFNVSIQALVNNCRAAVVSLNLPGSTGYGCEHTKAGIGDPHKLVRYIADVANYLRSLSWIDGEKIGLQGESWGGYLTMLAATSEYDSLFNYFISLVGVSSMAEMFSINARESGEENFVKYELPQRWGIPDVRYDLDADKIFSPWYHLAKVKKPMLAINGSNDQIVSLKQFELIPDDNQLITKVLIEGADHQINSQTSHVLQYLEEIVRFINENNGVRKLKTNDSTSISPPKAGFI